MKHPPDINSDQVKNTLMTALVRRLYSTSLSEIRLVSKKKIRRRVWKYGSPENCDPNWNAQRKPISRFIRYVIAPCVITAKEAAKCFCSGWRTCWRLDQHSGLLIRSTFDFFFFFHNSTGLEKHDFCLVKGRNLLHWSLFGTGENSLWHVKDKKWNGF